MSASYKRLIFILIDGAPFGVLNDLVQSGDLPAIAELAAAGNGVKQAVTCFPSTTGPAYIPYFMGLFPGSANLPGYRWLSRTHYSKGSRWTRPGICSYNGREALGFDADLPERPTWFDHFASSCSILNLLTKGCAPQDNVTRWKKPFLYAFGHYLHNWKWADDVAGRALVEAARAGRDFVACAFNGVDGHSHGNHARGEKTLASYQTIDRAIAKARAVLRHNGKLEETLWVIGSDHGHSRTHTHLDAADILKAIGFSCLYYPLIWRQRADCAVMVSGNGMCHIYFRNDEDWIERTAWEGTNARRATEGLLREDGIDFVAGRTADGTVVIQTRDGQGKIKQASGAYSYEFLGQDPLACGELSNVNERELLIRTFDSPRPDAAMQLSQLFRAERSGDLLVSAKEGFDLRGRWEWPHHHSTHGALNPAQMFVPVIFSHPLQANRFRTADVFPTTLRLLGKTAEDGIDGKALD